jgi:ELWxxDGT repeat protein
MQAITGGVRFTVHDGTTGTDTDWVSDGTTAGTHPVVTPPVPPPRTTGVVYNGRTYYAADDGTHGAELFSTDGTPDGARLVADINPGPDCSNPTSLTVARGLLYFNAYRPDIGSELWSTDGTAAGTHLVQDLYSGPGSSNPQQITDVRGTLYFVASDPLHRNALWKLPVGGPANVPLDFSYLLTLAQNYGKSGTFSSGDLNDDGQVNFDDLLLLAQNYGHPLQDHPIRRSLSRDLKRH